MLTDRDRAGAPPVIVINESMAKRYFKGEDPIGKRILIQELLYGQPGLGSEIAWEVVGIVGDEQTGDLGDTKSPGVYVRFAQSPTNDVNMVVRSASIPRRSPRRSSRRSTTSTRINQWPTSGRWIEIKSETVANDRLQTMLLATFATLALLLSAVGIYGVISYSVTQRMQELGIRAALGASRGGLLALVIRRGMTLAIGGLAVGLVASLALTRLLSSLLFGISPRDPVTVHSVAAVLVGVAFMACYIPARRAAGIDPTVALRYE